jgi:hypothetical protein
VDRVTRATGVPDYTVTRARVHADNLKTCHTCHGGSCPMRPANSSRNHSQPKHKQNQRHGDRGISSPRLARGANRMGPSPRLNSPFDYLQLRTSLILLMFLTYEYALRGFPGGNLAPRSSGTKGNTFMVRKEADWTVIEADYRAGSMSIREVARFHNVSEVTLRRRAKAEGWPRTARHITNAEIIAAGGRAL